MAALHDYLAKVHENLTGAESELVDGRYNSCARGAYYACFHAAIVALIQAGLTFPPSHPVAGHIAGSKLALSGRSSSGGNTTRRICVEP